MGHKILTKAVMATIPAMVESGMRASQIAERLGVRTSTLKVRACQVKISLRPPGTYRGRPQKAPLSDEATAYFRKRAEAAGTTVTELTGRILEIIARDDLYNAVIDSDPLKEAA